MISVAQHLETSALDFFDPMVGFHKGMLVLFNKKNFPVPLVVCVVVSFTSAELCAQVWSL